MVGIFHKSGRIILNNSIKVFALLSLVGCAKAQPTKPVNEQSDRYIVVFKQNHAEDLKLKSAGLTLKQVVSTRATALAESHRVALRKVYSVAIQGGVYEMTASEAAEIAQNPQVAYVEKNQKISINGSQQRPTWGLDRVDQAELPLNQVYNYPETTNPVNAYVIDTGVLASHQEFEGRAVSGYDFIDQDSDATDCNGHGTHVAGTIGGKNYGINKKANIVGVRVLDCSGSGTWEGVLEGIEWVTQNHIKPAVVNMSLGGPTSQAIDDAVEASINAGVVYVVAGGNESTSACKSSPARAVNAITVGATTKFDARASYSNYGNCLDLFAPGSDILSAWYSSSSSTRTISGTSMASPHVAGVASLYMSLNPQATPAQVAAALVAGAAAGKVGSPGSGSPNRLLNTQFLGVTQPPTDPPPTNPDPEPPGQPDGGLQSGVLVEGLSGGRGGMLRYHVSVPASASNLTVEISGGNGDADLYVRRNSEPSLNRYDCRPYSYGNLESCTASNAGGSTFYILINTFTPVSGLTLRATYQ